jgi:hypothetical protein
MLLACIAIFVACKLGSKKKHYFRNQMYFGDFTATNCPQKNFLQTPPIIEPIFCQTDAPDSQVFCPFTRKWRCKPKASLATTLATPSNG